jgi:hypothetical protein
LKNVAVLLLKITGGFLNAANHFEEGFSKDLFLHNKAAKKLKTISACTESRY